MNASVLSRAVLAAAILAGSPLSAQDGLVGDALRKALADQADDLWIYDDLDGAMARAQTTGKPLLVSFRCVP